MTTRITIHDRLGRPLSEIEAIFNRSWVMNDYGTGTITLTTRDMNTLENLLQFGNLVYAEHDSLPDWVGVVDQPRTWGNETVTITVYGYAYLLNWFITPKVMRVRGAGGGIFKELIDVAINQYKCNYISYDEVYGGGGNHNLEFNFYPLFQALKTLMGKTNGNFYFDPYLNNKNELKIEANYYRRMGALQNFTLYEGTNLTMVGAPLREQGKIVNRVTVYGQGSTWASRAAATVSDSDSISLYGVRHASYNSNNQTVNQLRTEAQNKLNKLAYPRISYKCEAIDVGDTFSWLRLGNTLRVEYYTAGFTDGAIGMKGLLRIKQMDYDEAQNKVVLYGEETDESRL
jgi:hypothetical protein